MDFHAVRILFVFLLLSQFAGSLRAEEVGCVTTAWKLIGANHKVCVYAFEDPDLGCVTCYLRQARTGGRRRRRAKRP